MKRREKLTIVVIVLVFGLAMTFERCEQRKFDRLQEEKRERLDQYEADEEAHFQRFEQCMTENNFEYSDALCEYCWEKTELK